MSTFLLQNFLCFFPIPIVYLDMWICIYSKYNTRRTNFCIFIYSDINAYYSINVVMYKTYIKLPEKNLHLAGQWEVTKRKKEFSLCIISCSWEFASLISFYYGVFLFVLSTLELFHSYFRICMHVFEQNFAIIFCRNNKNVVNRRQPTRGYMIKYSYTHNFTSLNIIFFFNKNKQ